VNPGYIYILQNPSLSESHLKIGRTERDPDERAAEISRGTGVPTPFEVVWWSESVDCHLAETMLHHHLAPYRTNTTREFFDLELDEAIRVARRAIHQSGGRTGGIAYFLRGAAGWIFHGFVRPLLRLPIQIILLAGLVISWAIRSVLLLAWGIIRAVFSVLGALLSARKGKRRRRKKRAAQPSRSQQRKVISTQSNPLYSKEILGALIWISLFYFLFTKGGSSPFPEMLSTASGTDLK